MEKGGSSKKARPRQWYLLLAAMSASATFIVIGLVVGLGDHLFGGSELPGATANPVVWVQIRPDEPDTLGRRIVRAIADGEKACPDIVVDGRKRQMRERVPLSRQDFSPTLCELELNPGEKAKFGNDVLPERTDDPTHILLLGDTGCRVTFYVSQACLHRDEWPFRDLSAAAARLASQIDIDLVIHVGDYHYREHACPDWHSGCRGSPAGDNWAVWKVDFFDAVRPLLLKAPWVMVRGNHENCERAGTGWLHLFDPYSAKGETKRCRDDTGGYVIRLKDQHFLMVLDTANAAARFELSDRPDTYRKTMEGVLKSLRAILPASGENAADSPPLVWLLLHQPLWGAYDKDHSQRIAQPDSLYDEELPLEAIRQVVRIADGAGLGISTVFSGDTHMFQRFLPDDDSLPIQIVAGTGGTALERAKDFSHIGQKMDENISLFGDRGRITATIQFGFVLLSRDADEWDATFYDYRGRAVLICPLPSIEARIAGRDARCRESPRATN